VQASYRYCSSQMHFRVGGRRVWQKITKNTPRKCLRQMHSLRVVLGIFALGGNRHESLKRMQNFKAWERFKVVFSLVCHLILTVSCTFIICSFSCPFRGALASNLCWPGFIPYDPCHWVKLVALWVDGPSSTSFPRFRFHSEIDSRLMWWETAFDLDVFRLNSAEAHKLLDLRLSFGNTL